jgi:hypothetical protein
MSTSSSSTSRRTCSSIVRKSTATKPALPSRSCATRSAMGLGGTPPGSRHLRRTAIRARSADMASRWANSSKPAPWSKKYLGCRPRPPARAGEIDHPLTRQRDPTNSRVIVQATKRSRHSPAFRKLAEIELPVAVDRYPSSRYALLEARTG